MDEDFGLDSGFDDGGSLDLDTESPLDDASFDTDYSLDDIGTDDFSGGSLDDTDFSSGAVDDDFESFNDSDLSDLDTDFSAEEMLTDTGSELDLSPDSIETDDFGDIETDLNLEEPGDSFDLDESVDGTETEPEFPADSDEGGYFEDIPNEVEPYVLEEAQTETTADTAESIPETEQDDRTPYEAMRDYMYEHNYGQMDYPEYSQDPEWQALNEQYTASLENTAPAEEITPESEAEFQEDISAVASDVPEDIMTEAAADIPEESMTETTADIPEETLTETTADTAESIPETEQDDRTPYEAMRDYMYEHNYGQMDYPEYSQDPEWQALNEQYTASLENTAPAEEITPESEAEFQEDISAVASDVPEDIMTEAAADIPEESMTETTADIPEETMTEATADIPEETLTETTADIPEENLTETTADTAESIPETEQDDRTPYEAMRDYMYEHNYGQMDYPEYSQDPEWQALNDAYTESLNTPADITDAAATDAQIPQDVQTLDNFDAAAADVNDWISEINPNFDPYDLDSAYDNNCGSCAFAVYQRFEGNTDIVASAENIATIEEMNALTGMEQVTMTPEEIQQTLLDQGNGAHAIIGIDRADGPGHWFNAANIDGKVVAIDGQTGEISDWPPDYGDVTNWDMSMKKGH